jgi:hypothetical protein
VTLTEEIKLYSSLTATSSHDINDKRTHSFEKLYTSLTVNLLILALQLLMQHTNNKELAIRLLSLHENK